MSPEGFFQGFRGALFHRPVEDPQAKRIPAQKLQPILSKHFANMNCESIREAGWGNTTDEGSGCSWYRTDKGSAVVAIWTGDTVEVHFFGDISNWPAVAVSIVEGITDGMKLIAE